MEESQNIEFKECWRDEYLRWICGFANAKGGRIYIGVNDAKEIVGVEDAARLMEDIPNKIQNSMGIVCDVNLLGKDEKKYIEIAVSPSAFPISYHGEFHYRSGSTKQQLKGNALTSFIISKTGMHWDATPVNNVTVDELDNDSFKIFRREALRSGRMSKENLEMSNAELLEALHLVTEDGKLTKAAVLLFHENPQKFCTGAYVKVGKFASEADILYQDVVDGSFFKIADKIFDLIYFKYLKAAISYDKETRIEKYPFPRDAVREGILNALIHNNWMACTPIQIKIFDDEMRIANDCMLLFDWDTEKLVKNHKSVPFNPSIAGAFFRAGYVESWGRGIKKICDACRDYGIPEPEFEIDSYSITVIFKALEEARIVEGKSTDVEEKTGNVGEKVGEKVGENVGEKYFLTETQQKILLCIEENPKISQTKISEKIGIRALNVYRNMIALQESGLIRRVGPAKGGHWEIIKKQNLGGK